MIETILTCPLGSKCEEIKDGKIHKCAWFIEIKGNNPQTDEPIDEKGCAIAWLPILQIESANVTRSVHSAVVSTREENVKRQDTVIDILHERQLKGMIDVIN